MKYLVVYQYEKDKFTQGVGNCSAIIENNPPAYEDIRDIEKQLAEMNNWDNTVVLNLLPLSEESEGIK